MLETQIPVQTVEKVIGLEVVDSTNNVAKELAEQGEAANTMVLACRQTSGRGRFERTFSAEEGGVYFTLILRPRVYPSRNQSFSIKAAQAVSEALNALFHIKTKIKEPNDVLAWEPSLKDSAVSLKQLLGQDIMKEVVLEEVLEHFWRRYAEWERSVC